MLQVCLTSLGVTHPYFVHCVQ